MISGGGITAVAATAHLTRVDVITQQPLDWPKLTELTEMFVVADEAALRAPALPAQSPKQPGESILVHLAYDFLGGERLCVEVAAQAGHTLDARLKINRLVANTPLYFNFYGGGATIVNPANIVRVLVRSSQQRELTGVWPANLQSDS